MSSKHVFITGATSGIGQSLVEQYITNGDIVTACGRNKEKLSALINVHNTCLFDINNPDEISQSTQNVDDIDILILNAGDCRYIDNAKQFNGDLFADIISTNLTSLGYLLQSLLPKVNSGGQIVFISSSATILPFPRSEAYGASKAGMDYLANSLRLDLLPHNIDVTLVHPGFVKTPLTNKNTFAMPFLITSDEAALRIIKGVEQHKTYLHFPKRFTFILKTLSLLPSPLWQWLITRKQQA
jgi:short-subunit dehydrogenase